MIDKKDPRVSRGFFFEGPVCPALPTSDSSFSIHGRYFMREPRDPTRALPNLNRWMEFQEVPCFGSSI
jgi:hypothetical protein